MGEYLLIFEVVVQFAESPTTFNFVNLQAGECE